MNTQKIQKTLENIRSLCDNIEKAFGFFHDDIDLYYDNEDRKHCQLYEDIVIHLDENEKLF